LSSVAIDGLGVGSTDALGATDGAVDGAAADGAVDGAVEARGGAQITVYEQNVERATKAELWAPGEAVQLTWSPDHTFVVADDAPIAAAPN